MGGFVSLKHTYSYYRMGGSWFDGMEWDFILNGVIDGDVGKTEIINNKFFFCE